jgi:hypothetical protein
MKRARFSRKSEREKGKGARRGHFKVHPGKRATAPWRVCFRAGRPTR